MREVYAREKQYWNANAFERTLFCWFETTRILMTIMRFRAKIVVDVYVCYRRRRRHKGIPPQKRVQSSRHATVFYLTVRWTNSSERHAFSARKPYRSSKSE